MKTIMVIGCGSIGERHAKNLEFLGHQVVRFDPIKFPKENLHQNLSKVDAVVIAAPTNMHDDYMEESIGYYNKPTFVEKPIADNLDGSVIADSTKALMCGYNLRFHACVKKAKEWFDEGEIGKPLWANFTLGQHSEKEPYLRDGVVLNWSHELDLALYLLGVGQVTTSSTHLTDGKDDISDILLTHEGGCRSTIHLDYVSDPEIRRFRIQGTEGIIEVDLVRFTADLYCATPTEPFRWKDHTWNDTYIEEMQAFLDRCDGKETIGCTGQEGLEVLKICLEVRKQAGLE